MNISMNNAEDIKASNEINLHNVTRPLVISSLMRIDSLQSPEFTFSLCQFENQFLDTNGNYGIFKAGVNN